MSDMASSVHGAVSNLLLLQLRDQHMRATAASSVETDFRLAEQDLDAWLARAETAQLPLPTTMPHSNLDLEFRQAEADFDAWFAQQARLQEEYVAPHTPPCTPQHIVEAIEKEKDELMDLALIAERKKQADAEAAQAAPLVNQQQHAAEEATVNTILVATGMARVPLSDGELLQLQAESHAREQQAMADAEAPLRRERRVEAWEEGGLQGSPR